MVLSEELSILESFCLRPMMRNSVLEELRVRSDAFSDVCPHEVLSRLKGVALKNYTNTSILK